MLDLPRGGVVGLAGRAESGTRLRRTWASCEALRPYVASFDLRDDHLGSETIHNPLPARSDCFLQFHFKEPYLVINSQTGEIHRSPSCVLVGPHTARREDLIWTGDLKVFTIRFSAVGFRSIFGIPSRELRDTAISAELALGPEVLAFEAILVDTEDQRLPVVAEAFLLAQLDRQRNTSSSFAVSHQTKVLQLQPTGVSLRGLAAKHNMCLRQMERLFDDFVGLSPKQFQRLHRAKKALTLHQAHPEWDWSCVASASGYFDQAHLIREFRSLNGSTPASFARSSQLAHEFRSRP